MMDKLTIYLGTKNISSWSLRPWLALMQTGADFEEIVISLDQPDTKEKISKISPSGRVPLLKHGDLLVCDSLAICEYLAEIFPDTMLWPADKKARAHARSISAEMHAGFPELRKHLSVDVRARHKNYSIPDTANPDIERICQIWENCRTHYGKTGEFLFGHFTIADAMFAPVATRFITYDVKLPLIAQQYITTIMALPAMQQWCKQAEK